MMSRDQLIDRAVNLLTASRPLPVDLIATLLGLGVDVKELERKYAA